MSDGFTLSRLAIPGGTLENANLGGSDSDWPASGDVADWRFGRKRGWRMDGTTLLAKPTIRGSDYEQEKAPLNQLRKPPGIGPERDEVVDRDLATRRHAFVSRDADED